MVKDLRRTWPLWSWQMSCWQVTVWVRLKPAESIIQSDCTRKVSFISVAGPWEQISSLWFPCVCVCRRGGWYAWFVCPCVSSFMNVSCQLTASATNSQAVCLWCPPIIVSSSHFIASTQFYFTVNGSVGDRVYTLWNVQHLIYFQHSPQNKSFTIKDAQSEDIIQSIEKVFLAFVPHF